MFVFSFSSERINSTLSDAVRQVRKGSIVSLRSDASNPAEASNESEPGESRFIDADRTSNPTKRSDSSPAASPQSNAFAIDKSNSVTVSNGNGPLDNTESRLSSDTSHPQISTDLPASRTPVPPANPIATTEAKREKHRSKKQSQRAAKRAANENATNAESERVLNEIPSSPTTTTDAGLSGASAYYPVSSNGDSEVNWNAFIDSQNTQYGQYFYNGMIPSTSTENNTWTVVLPSSSARTQRVVNSTGAGRTGSHETTDWKTTSSSSGSSKRRIFISVSRHDIGKVIGQGGAVVSALRNMSGIQIDIESARSDEAPDRMVYLRGPSDAVQRTYEAIQGLLNGSVAGNDVLLMYAAMKKSTTTANATIGKNILSALTSKSSGAVTLTTASNTSKVVSSTGRGGTSSGKSRKGAKTTVICTSSSTASSTAIRSSSTQPPALLALSRAAMNSGKVTSGTTSNSNNNSTVMCSASTTASPAVSTIMSTRVTNSNAASWSSKVSGNLSTSSKGNFAAVAASGLVAHAPRSGTKVIDSSGSTRNTSHGLSKYAAVPSLMSSFPSVTPTTAPVSLLSLNVSPFSTTSQMFPDLALSFSTANDLPPDSLDEVSFPPLNPKSRTTTGTVTEEQEPSPTSGTSNSLVTTTVASSITDVPVVSVASDSEGTGNILTSVVADPTTFAKTAQIVETPVISSSIDTPEVTNSDSSIPIFKPLTVSPPAATTAPASQPPTPVGSGSSYSASCVGTSPATTTQTRSFARAPGSERSAHQRGTTVISISNSVSDTYPPSLMSLDVTAGLSRPSTTVINESLLITPTKRATSPELRESDFHPPVAQTRFRPDQATEWLSSDLKSDAPAAASVFAKTPGFSLDSGIDLTSSVSMNPSIGIPVTQISSATTKSSFRVPGSTHTELSSGWPMQPAGLNPNAVAFQPSAFQQPASTTHQPSVNTHVTSSLESCTPVVSAPVMRTDFSGLGGSECLANAYSLDAALPSGSVHTTCAGKSTLPTALHPPVPQQAQPIPAGSLSGAAHSSVTMCGSTFAAHNTVASTVRSKPLLSVTPNVYIDQRNTVQNGFTANNAVPPQLQSSSTLLNNAQLRPMFAAGQQSASPQQQPTLGANHLPGALSQAHQNAVTTRLGGGTSPHAMLNNQTQIPIGPSSYTPPPYMPGFIQPNTSGQATNNMSVGATHPGGAYTPHLLNGECLLR